MKSKNLSILEEYNKKLPLYQDFCNAMQNLLSRLLANNEYKYQIASRIKSFDSLKQKISRKAEKGIIYKKLEDIHDIAGIRIIFYLENDKKKFISDLYKELTPQKLELFERNKEKGYMSTHVIARFGPKRLILGEYKKYKGLQCEIQLTSALYHAWAEIEHDIFYKLSEKVINNQQQTVNELKRELEEAMINHIQKASDLLEFVVEKVKNIKSN
ncbi:MAG: RelA/SpoT domain-containing protein [Syntrophaceae bacterium]|nr:RelA/SpoT domain-containing protein [Syntrophaceae bacterium]